MSFFIILSRGLNDIILVEYAIQPGLWCFPRSDAYFSAEYRSHVTVADAALVDACAASASEGSASESSSNLQVVILDVDTPRASKPPAVPVQNRDVLSARWTATLEGCSSTVPSVAAVCKAVRQYAGMPPISFSLSTFLPDVTGDGGAWQVNPRYQRQCVTGEETAAHSMHPVIVPESSHLWQSASVLAEQRAADGYATVTAVADTRDLPLPPCAALLPAAATALAKMEAHMAAEAEAEAEAETVADALEEVATAEAEKGVPARKRRRFAAKRVFADDFKFKGGGPESRTARAAVATASGSVFASCADELNRRPPVAFFKYIVASKPLVSDAYAFGRSTAPLPVGTEFDAIRAKYPGSGSAPWFSAASKQPEKPPEKVYSFGDKSRLSAMNAVIATAAAGDATATSSVAGDSTTAAGALAPVRPCERPRLDFRGKRILAPLTTTGNLPFRRICVDMGAEVTISEMAVAQRLLEGKGAEWSLLRRHVSEKMFGIQVAVNSFTSGAALGRALAELDYRFDFLDLNSCCPIDCMHTRRMGAFMLSRPPLLASTICGLGVNLPQTPLTVKVRTGNDKKIPNLASQCIPKLKDLGLSAVAIHGRSRLQRYSKASDWNYISECSKLLHNLDIQCIGNGDVFSAPLIDETIQYYGCDAAMVGRTAIVKPWIFQEWESPGSFTKMGKDISPGERLHMYRDFCEYGLTHWGADARGISNTRFYFLEWMSFTHRYVPVGILDSPILMNQRETKLSLRSPLETLLASPFVSDWVNISAMFLGPPPAGFKFVPKHKGSAVWVDPSTAQTVVGSTEADDGVDG